jgi:WD40 repeat protein
VGSYEIVGALGVGGMGEVYRARDAKLNREVALKVLPEALAADPDRLARFRREAQVLAALNHPNIAHIHGFDDAGAIHAIVMELVEGPTLADRIAAGPLPLAEALPIARQIADALEAAHEQGIIHRDLKPANVKVREDGTVKVLDFGLAKALTPDSASATADGANSPTLTARATQMGMIIGTAAYMAPEQAKGRPVDRRADVWAFGVVLLEMLTGQRAFKGEDVSETLASVLARDADLTTLPTDTPAPVRRLIARCLEKDPKTRIRAIGDAMRRLGEDLAAGAEPARRERRAGGLRPLALVGCLTAGVLIGAVAVWIVGRPNDSRAPARMLVAPVEAMTAGPNESSVLTVAPDGSYLIYAAGKPRRLFMRRLDQMESVAIPGTEGALSPFISPDGESLGFMLGNQLKSVPRSGGAPTVLHTFKAADTNSDAGAWAPDGTIYIGAGQDGYGTIWKIPPGGGTAEPLLPLADERGIRREDAWPQVLPGGKTLLFGTMSGDVYWECRQAKIQALDLASRKEKLILDRACFVRYVETGYVIFVTADNQLAIAPFDATTLELTGPPRPLPFQVPLRSRRFANLVAAEDGTLVYESGPALPESRLIWLDRSGKEIPVTDQPRAFENARVSPQADRIAAVITSPEGAGRIWLYDTARGQLSPVSPAGSSYRFLAWTPDGKSVFTLRVGQGAAGIYRIAVDGAFAETLVYDPKTPWAAPVSVSPDGRFLAVLIWSTDTDKDWDIRIVPLDGSGPPVYFARESSNEVSPTFSPDGRWLAYSSDRAGRAEVFVKRFPEGGAPVQVSRDGGRALFWNQEGTEIFSFREATGTGQVVASSVNLKGAAPAIGESRVLFDLPLGLGPSGWRDWADRSRDGNRLLLLRPVVSESRTVGVAVNWLRSLEKASSAAGGRR